MRRTSGGRVARTAFAGLRSVGFVLRQKTQAADLKRGGPLYLLRLVAAEPAALGASSVE